VWVAACSTGEETYSLAMLLREKMASAACDIELQVFASDIDADAVASAREGLYPATIEADVSPARLARFFSREERGYQVLPELRASIVFTVHDVLVNPPFSQLDLVSCRNLLIYLNPEAQAKMVSQFDFALRDGGVLLIGNAETLLNADARFEIISRPERVYRHIARNHSRHAALSVNPGDATRLQPQRGPRPGPARRSSVADVARSRLLDTYAPAAVLVNRNHECLYFFGSPISARASGPADSRRARPCAKGTADQTSFRDPPRDPDERASGGCGRHSERGRSRGAFRPRRAARVERRRRPPADLLRRGAARRRAASRFDRATRLAARHGTRA
jgi:hypothetical protein